MYITGKAFCRSIDAKAAAVNQQIIPSRIAPLVVRIVVVVLLSLAPQCGFASCEIGNKLTEEEQWAKLALVKEIAEEVWG